MPNVVASDELQLSSDAEATSTQSSYVKVKEIQVSVTGTIRVKFDIKDVPNTQYAYGKVYVNDSPVGVEHVDGDGVYSTYTDDISVTANDYVQLYQHRDSNDGGQTSCRNFRLYWSAPTLFERTNSVDVSSAASRLVSFARLLTFKRAGTISVSSAVSRLVKLGRTTQRALSVSVSNAVSRIAYAIGRFPIRQDSKASSTLTQDSRTAVGSLTQDNKSSSTLTLDIRH